MEFGRFRRAALVLICAMLGGSVLAAESQSSTPAQRLSRQFAEMESMQAKFVQRIQDEKGNLLQEASGRVVVKRPRQFYWKTEQPYQHLVVTDGQTLWLYDVDLEQVSRQPFSKDLDRAPALILSGESASLAKQYTINVDEDKDGTSSTLVFSLVPLSDDNVFRKLLLRFVDGKIASMSMQDSFQQLTKITFSDVVYNPAVDPMIFQFKPPAGIDVIENES